MAGPFGGVVGDRLEKRPVVALGHQRGARAVQAPLDQRGPGTAGGVYELSVSVSARSVMDSSLRSKSGAEVRASGDAASLYARMQNCQRPMG